MAEVIGVISSAITIAGLFKACIEAFEVIKAAQSQELDFQKAVLKLNIEKCRLYTWGESMGLTTPPTGSQPRPLDMFEFTPLVVDILKMLLQLFSDTSKLQDRYGCRAATEENPSSQPALTTTNTDHIGNLSTCFSNFHFDNGEVDTSIKKKIRWLVQDRKKFPGLVSEAKEFIDGLQDITKSIAPISLQTQATAHRIQQISQPDTLQLVADVCETDHPAISDAASTRLEIVSMAQTQRDGIELWANDIRPVTNDDTLAEIESLTVTELKHRLLDLMAKAASQPQVLQMSDVISPRTNRFTSQVDMRYEIKNGIRQRDTSSKMTPAQMLRFKLAQIERQIQVDEFQLKKVQRLQQLQKSRRTRRQDQAKASKNNPPTVLGSNDLQAHGTGFKTVTYKLEAMTRSYASESTTKTEPIDNGAQKMQEILDKGLTNGMSEVLFIPDT